MNEDKYRVSAKTDQGVIWRMPRSGQKRLLTDEDGSHFFIINTAGVNIIIDVLFIKNKKVLSYKITSTGSVTKTKSSPEAVSLLTKLKEKDTKIGSKGKFRAGTATGVLYQKGSGETFTNGTRTITVSINKTASNSFTVNAVTKNKSNTIVVTSSSAMVKQGKKTMTQPTNKTTQNLMGENEYLKILLENALERPHRPHRPEMNLTKSEAFRQEMAKFNALMQQGHTMNSVIKELIQAYVNISNRRIAGPYADVERKTMDNLNDQDVEIIANEMKRDIVRDTAIIPDRMKDMFIQQFGSIERAANYQYGILIKELNKILGREEPLMISGDEFKNLKAIADSGENLQLESTQIFHDSYTGSYYNREKEELIVEKYTQKEMILKSNKTGKLYDANNCTITTIHDFADIEEFGQ